MNQKFHNKLSTYAKANDSKNANILVMSELGKIIVRERKDFIDLLSECGINANENMNDQDLVDLYLQNISNKKLLLGTAFLVNIHNKSIGFDGSNEVSDEGVKVCYDCLKSNFSGDEETSNFIPAILAAGANLGGKALEAQQRKKYGVQDMLNKKNDAKNAIVQQILAQRQAEADAKVKKQQQAQKTTKTVLIISGIIAGLAIIGTIIYFVKKKK